MPCGKKKYSGSNADNALLAMTGHYNLFGDQGFKVGPAHGRVTGGIGAGQAPPKKKQGALFGKSGLPGQMNLFADKAVPDDLVAKPKKKAKKTLFGMAERGQKIGEELGGTAGGIGGAALAARAKLPKKPTMAAGVAVGRKAGGYVGRKVGKRLQRHALAEDTATRLAFSLDWDRHEENLGAALASVEFG